jgi:hypothetical protein
MQERRVDAGVRIFEDHRDNLTVDVHSDLVLGRAAEMRHSHSEAAMLWNVFRALQNVDARLWLPRLLRRALPDVAQGGAFATPAWTAQCATAEFHWWRRHDLPAARHAWLRDAALSGNLPLEHYAPRSIPEKRAEIERRLAADLSFEDPVEIPLCIETAGLWIGFEAVYRGNLRRHTTYDAHRDAVVRLLEAGIQPASTAGKRHFTVVVCTDPRLLNLETARLVERYRGGDRLAAALPHREPGDAIRAAADGLGLLRWKDLGAVLLETKGEERVGAFDLAVLDEIIKYLGRKDIGFNFFRRLK